MKSLRPSLKCGRTVDRLVERSFVVDMTVGSKPVPGAAFESGFLATPPGR